MPVPRLDPTMIPSASARGNAGLAFRAVSSALDHRRDDIASQVRILPRHWRAVYTVCWLEFEVCNGGHHSGTAASSHFSDILTFRMLSNVTIQVRQRGTLTLPAELREKYRLADGDPLSVVDLDGAILLTPKVLIVPRIAAEMERLRKAKKLSLKDLGGPTRED